MRRTLKRRRKEGKTDYSRRIKLLKSSKPRIVFRKTNRYIISQYIQSHEAKDKVVVGVTSKDLLDYGWSKEKIGSLKSIPASYLTGLLIAKSIKSKGLDSPVIDSGMIRILGKNRFFAFLKGLRDGSVEINCDEEKFPNEKTLKGEGLKAKSLNFEKIKSQIEK